MATGFKREELRSRYDVPGIHEDQWHSYCGQKTARIVGRHLTASTAPSDWLLNAGSGPYKISQGAWREVALDLFTNPLRNRDRAICASIERLPFRAHTFGAVVCVGEVMGYCDPAKAVSEFSRVLVPTGILICDFGSSRSFTYWRRASYGRAADLVTDCYNGTPERIWIYDPTYVKSLLVSAGFRLKSSVGIHTWSALARRVGASTPMALLMERWFGQVRLPSAWAYLTTIVAVRSANET